MKEAAREFCENYIDLLMKLHALASTVSSIHHAMEYEGAPPHILATYITIQDAIDGIIQRSMKEKERLSQLIKQEQESTGED